MGFGPSAAQRQNFERMMTGFAPVSWWKLVETSGTTLADSGSANFPGILNQFGTAGTLGTASGPATHSRVQNNALRVNNTAATGGPYPVGNTTGASGYQIFGSTGLVTTGCFIRMNTAGTQGFYSFPMKIGTSTVPGYRFTLTLSSRNVGFLWQDGTSQFFPSGATLPNDTAWHFVCGVYNRAIPGSNGTGIFTTYVDGVAINANNFPAGFGSCNQTSTNMYPLSGSNTPNGIYDFSDIFIIPQALTTQQVRALYTAGTR